MTTLEKKRAVNLSALIGPSFYEVHSLLDSYTHFWLSGGRGSGKSSFISLEIILGIMLHPDTNAVVLRKVGETIRDSVLSQLEWAADMLGVRDMWDIKTGNPEMIYKSTGQRILFRGADKPRKIKSIKPAKGYVRYVWYEEVDEFGGMGEIRTINQSLLRGGDKYNVFYSYNPPKNRRSWVNREFMTKRDDTLYHTSDYRSMPREWLGDQFFLEAEYLKKTHKDLYEHEYLGKATGTGTEVFNNLKIRAITQKERDTFDNLRCGIDFGFAADPFVFILCYLHNNRLFILDEIYAKGMTNRRAADEICKKGIQNKMIVCDSAEPKSINDLRQYGLRVRGARKGPDSIDYGIRYLQSLEKIIIDPKKCPNAAREFSEYELERDKDGEIRSTYPDKNNHTIDAVRYALESDINNRRARIIDRKEIDL